jgi:hypothetical protein
VATPAGRPGFYAERVEILLWLLPPVVVTLLAMAWVGWLGREGRGEVDPEVAVRRMAAALNKPTPQRYVPPRQRRERSTGVAVRPSRAPSRQKRAS